MSIESLKKYFESVPLEKQSKDIRIIEYIKAIGFYWRFIPFLVWLAGAHLILIPVMFLYFHIYGSFQGFGQITTWLSFLLVYLIVTWIIIIPLTKKFLFKTTKIYLKKIEKITSTYEGTKSLQKIRNMHPSLSRTFKSAKERRFYHWFIAP
ncbi:MAG: hypothetical protein ACOCQG_01265 [Candidatus Nanoarchaeia archaeon]